MSTLFSILCFVVAGALAADSPAAKAPPVTLTVYYESLCPDSVHFIKDKLIPTYLQTSIDFKSMISNLTLVPWGHANVTNETLKTFSCQHGPSECDGNKLHACAIKHISDEVTLLKYIGCLMNKTDPPNKNMSYPSIDSCKELLNSSFADVSTCYNGTEGQDLLLTYANLTKNTFNGTFSVPYIIFNNTKNDDLSKKSYDNLRKTLCTEVGVNKDGCSDPSAGGSPTLSATFTLVAALVFFLIAKQ